MKTFFLSFLLLFCVSVTYSQITITATDVQNYFALGTTYLDRVDTLTTSTNIGAPGSFTLDLSALQWATGVISTAVVPASTSTGNQYPTATVALHQQIGAPTPGDSYVYYNIGADVNVLGVAVVSSLFSTVVKFLPSNQVTKTPMTLGTTWSSSFTDSTYTTFAGLPPITSASTETVDRIVDGYGTITLPGKTIEVLRIKYDTRTSGQMGYSRNINYEYIAKSGEQVAISVSDTNAPTSGVVAVTSISWQSSSTTDVRDQLEGATDYRLLNNYPNPFNPSTKIAYYVPSISKVDISVYNVMGQKVADVYNGISTKGYQEVNFNASTLASGTYLYKMNAVSLDGTQTFSSTGKMLLMK